MLPAAVRAALAEALWDPADSAPIRGDGSADRPDGGRGAATPAGVAPYLFVVQAGEVFTFNSLRSLTWARPDLLGVVFDRRQTVERRQRRESGHAERRRSVRRHAKPMPSWAKRGFLLVSPPGSSPVGRGDRPDPARREEPARLPPPAVAAHRPTTSVQANRMATLTPEPTRSAPLARPALPAPARRGPAHVAPRPVASEPTPRRTGAGTFTRALGILFVLGAGSVAGFLLWGSDRVAEVAPPDLAVDPAPAVSMTPRAVAPPRLDVAPRGPTPDGGVRSPALRPVRPSRSDPSAGSGAAVPRPEGLDAVAKRCVPSSAPTLAVQDGTVLGALVGMRFDADSRPPRCLFVVRRDDGALSVVDSAHAEARLR
jgi:hypothetical protein